MAGIVRVALVVPLSGTLGLIGPGAVNCAALAAREINEAGGILGRAVELRLVDGGRPALEVAIELRTLVRRGEAQAVVGVHSSDVRVALVSALGAAVPYVYTPPYEGGERAPGVYLAGETPDRQVRPVLRWLAERNRGSRWFLLGNDYVWPRRVSAAARAYLRALGAVSSGTCGGVDVERCWPRSPPPAPTPCCSRSSAPTWSSSPRVRRDCAGPGGVGGGGGRAVGVGGDATGELDLGLMGYFASIAPTPASIRRRYAPRFGRGAVPGGTARV